MERRRFSAFLVTVILLSGADGQRLGRQRTANIVTTITIAVTELVFETQPSLCVSLIDASRPCVGRRAVWNRIEGQSVSPTAVQAVEKTMEPLQQRPTDDLELRHELETSLESNWRAAQSGNRRPVVSALLHSLTHWGFSSALGLTRSLTNTVYETRTFTKTYTETIGSDYFEIRDCIPPFMHYPICSSTTTGSFKILPSSVVYHV